MKKLDLIANAKINLSLDVLSKRSDGYHEVRMLMQSVKLHDVVTVEEACGKQIEISCSSQWVPPGRGNIAFKAAELITDRFKLNTGLKITIDKRIPVSAGLAGGSTDAAAVIKGMNIIFELGMDMDRMMEAGAQIGADVPFCLNGGTMLAEGIGEVLTPVVPSLEGISLLLVKPGIGVSTAWVYNNLILEDITSRPDTEMLAKAIEEADIGYIAANMKNVLETVTIKRYPVISEIKQELLNNGALGSMMSGSGPSVFGIFNNTEAAETAMHRIRKCSWECILTETTSGESGT